MCCIQWPMASVGSSDEQTVRHRRNAAVFAPNRFVSSQLSAANNQGIDDGVLPQLSIFVLTLRCRSENTETWSGVFDESPDRHATLHSVGRTKYQ